MHQNYTAALLIPHIDKPSLFSSTTQLVGLSPVLACKQFCCDLMTIPPPWFGSSHNQKIPQPWVAAHCSWEPLEVSHHASPQHCFPPSQPHKAIPAFLKMSELKWNLARESHDAHLSPWPQSLNTSKMGGRAHPESPFSCKHSTACWSSVLYHAVAQVSKHTCTASPDRWAHALDHTSSAAWEGKGGKRRAKGRTRRSRQTFHFLSQLA